MNSTHALRQFDDDRMLWRTQAHELVRAAAKNLSASAAGAFDVDASDLIFDSARMLQRAERLLELSEAA